MLGDGPSAARLLELAASCRPYLELLPDAVLSHTTAARLHGMPLPPSYRHEPVLHLARSPNKPVSRRRYVRCHRLALLPGEVVFPTPGLRLTSPLRTWFDLAGVLTLPDLVAAGDWLISEHQRNFGTRRHAVVSLEELRGYVHARRQVPGVQRARRALELMRVGVDSPPETHLRLMLHSAGLPAFVPNLPLLDESGHPVVWVDLGCEAYRTCVEYDGGHHLSRDQQTRDNHRDLLVAELGWHQVKTGAADLRLGGAWVAAKVKRGLALGGWTDTEVA